MECEESLERMMRALDDELPDGEWLALEAHLEACDRCRARWEGLLAAEEVLREMPILSPPPGFVGRVMARVDRCRARQHAFFGGLALAAGTALVILIGILPILWTLPGWASLAVVVSHSGGLLLDHLVGAARLLLNSLGLLAGALLVQTLPLALCTLMTAMLLAGLWWGLLRRWQTVAT